MPAICGGLLKDIEQAHSPAAFSSKAGCGKELSGESVIYQIQDCKPDHILQRFHPTSGKPLFVNNNVVTPVDKTPFLAIVCKDCDDSKFKDYCQQGNMRILDRGHGIF